VDFESIVWEWPERRGLEHLRLLISPEGVRADGLVVAEVESQVIRFRYSIFLDAEWQLRRCVVISPGSQSEIWLAVDRHGAWTVDQQPRPDLEGCTSFDIIDSPFPKSAILRSIDLGEGASKKIKIAQIDNRQMRALPVVQEWQHLAPPREHVRSYRCLTQDASIEIHFDGGLLPQLCRGRWRMTSAHDVTGQL
jgi:uncharacterized protein